MREPIKLIDGGDLDFERQVFTAARDYDRLKEIVRQKWYAGSPNTESAWFRGVLEFLYVKGFELTPREETGKVLPFKK